MSREKRNLCDSKMEVQVTVSNKYRNLVEAKQQQWNHENHDFMTTYSSSQRMPQIMTAIQYVGQEGNFKRSLIKTCSEGGQPAQTGKKTTGEFVDELSKSFYKLDFRHPIPYTVKLRTQPKAALPPIPA